MNALKFSDSFFSWRFYGLLGAIIFIIISLACRAFYLSILKQHFLRCQGNERILRLLDLPAMRGIIFDRHHFPLAASTYAYSVWINPQLFSPTRHEIMQLAFYLGKSVQALTTLVRHGLENKRTFVYIQRGITPEIADRVRSLSILGLYLQSTYRRYYPEGEVTAHLVGLTNVDHHGIEGVELGYDQWLQGDAGKKWVMQDRLGRVIADIYTVRNGRMGQNLVLSIDRRIQYLAFQALLSAIKKYQAHSGSVVVLDVRTGEVLAMANYPTFNPNAHPIEANSHLRNRAVTDLFEPGSTMKAFSIASALETGRYQPTSLIDTSPGQIRIENHLVQDERDYGPLTLAQIMQVSSNVGVSKIILGLPANQLWGLFHQVGFGEITGIGFPGERSGLLRQYSDQGQLFMRATLGFGYGLSVTALQLARAYSVIAHEGMKLPVSLLRVNRLPEGEVVMKKEVAQQMLFLLESVIVNKGTGILAHIPGYRVAGKTGTAKKAKVGGYQKDDYTASFVGIAPVSQPRVVIAVVIHDPRGAYHSGGRVAAPVFAIIMRDTLHLLHILPDEIAA